MQSQKVHMSRKQFRIGDLAKELKVKKFVIRFWEKEFDLKSDRSHGGQRFYTSEDLQTFLLIKDLLYGQGFTIAGAKKQLEMLLSQGAEAIEKVIERGLETNVAAPEASISCDDSDESDAQSNTEVTPVIALPAPVFQMPELAPSDIQAAVMLEHMHEEPVTPATVASCSCDIVLEKLEPLKEQLRAFKALLETNH